MKLSTLAALVAAAVSMSVFSGSAHAQLIVGTTSNQNPSANGGSAVPSAYHINLSNSSATPLWATSSSSNTKVNGVTADQANRRLFTNDAARLATWNYGTQPTAPTIIGGLYRYNPTTNFIAATGFDDLVFIPSSTRLYGWTQFSSSVFSRGIYEIPYNQPLSTWINPSNPAQVVTGLFCTNQLWSDTTGTFAFQGLAFNPTNGLFYGVNSAANTAGRGLYTIDAFNTTRNLAPVKIADLPAGAPTSIDGLVLGDNGRLYMSVKPATSATISIYTYDLTTNAYLPDVLQLTYSLTNEVSRATGLAWAPTATLIPEPAAMGLLPLAGLLAGRRRK